MDKLLVPAPQPVWMSWPQGSGWWLLLVMALAILASGYLGALLAVRPLLGELATRPAGLFLRTVPPPADPGGRQFVVRAGLGLLVLAALGFYLESKASALDE